MQKQRFFPKQHKPYKEAPLSQTPDKATRPMTHSCLLAFAINFHYYLVTEAVECQIITTEFRRKAEYFQYQPKSHRKKFG